jgi:hypothetical protein
MKTWDHGRLAKGALVTLAILASAAPTTGKAEVNANHDTSVRNTGGKLVFMLTTGFEDLEEVRLCLQDIKAAKASGYMEDVIWLVRGRGVDALGSPEGVLARPPEIVKLAREVKATGVPIIASADALKQQHISIASLDPKPTDVVEDSATLMVDLVSKSYHVIRY